MEDLFYHIYLLVQRKKILAFTIAVIFLLGCGFIAAKIRFEEDITQIIPKTERSDDLSKALKRINFADKITILLEKSDHVTTDKLTEVAATFLDSLASDSLYIKSVTGRIGQEEMEQTYAFIYENLPFFLDQNDYAEISRRLSPDSIAEQVGQNYRTLLSPTGMVAKEFIQKDPLGLAFIGLNKIRSRAVGDKLMLYDDFIVTKDSSKLLLFIDPVYQGADTEHNMYMVHHLKSLKRKLEDRYKDEVQLSFYGSSFIAVANAEQIKTDISTTVLISMSVLMILLVLFYRKLYIPLLVFIPSVFAALFSIACLYLYKPVISAISLSIGAVLIGITIDYALHVLTHYKKSADVKDLYRELTRPLLMSGATNAVAFLCLLFVHSNALVDLGIFASLCIFSSAIFTLLIIPHLYRPNREITHSSFLDKLASFPFEQSKALVFICLFLFVVSLFTSSRVGYNNNISDLNFVPDELKSTERKLDTILNTSSKSIYLVATGKNLNEAAKKAEQLEVILDKAKNSGEILAYNGMNIIPLSEEAQRQKNDSWRRFWTREKLLYVEDQLQQAGDHYGFSAETHAAFYSLLEKERQLLPIDDLKAQKSLGFADFITKENDFVTISCLVKLEASKRDQFIHTVEEHTDVLVIDRQNLNETFLGQLRDDFNRLVGYSFIAVLLILWLFFRRLELVLLSAIPIGLTGFITAGLMGLFGLEFNIFSAIVCTLVFGHGVDFSIFMTAALQRQYSTGKDELQTYRTSIILAVLTTVLAIGALIFAKHPALLSIAAVSLIGVFAAVIVTFVFYPLLFRFFISNRAKKGKSPFTLRILFFSILFFIYYGLGCILLSFLCRVVLALLPLGNEKRDQIFRKLMGVFMKSVLYFHPLTRNKTMNPYHEKFDQPAVIIANHSSFLDTLSLGMLVPKGIFLVNDWVWNSPIFGRAVQALGFYPVSQGLESGIDFLRSKVEQGYSLIVFPEGTRSYDNVVKRFHKGAFYLAEQFDLDILPIYLLGNGDVLPKGDILIFDGMLRPVIGKRIRQNEVEYGSTYLSKTKSITKNFRTIYHEWRLKMEDASYFNRKLELAYLFKDPEIIAAVKQNIRLYATYYYELNPLLGDDKKIVHWSDSFGEHDYLLSLQQGNRKVFGVIRDPEKRQVAESIYWRIHRQVSFSEVSVESADALVIHPSIVLRSADKVQLQFFQKIYTFNEQPLLVQLGWTEVVLSSLIRQYVNDSEKQ
ncbi:1-acyl-sn-glycerol-3-phosphate acyltransferase [Sphingobacterium sp. LRF_L2]|uniref:1-acyl-sn-glycerol-3-phosphate acyltransferase n=1 Tax=Sphingobacterium sp. LRF_L2 TaxID=3369421 RepID=UPI003F5EF9D5